LLIKFGTFCKYLDYRKYWSIFTGSVSTGREKFAAAAWTKIKMTTDKTKILEIQECRRVPDLNKHDI
jgi:hypothetical protein